MYRWNFTNGKNVEQTERDAKRLFPEDRWNKLHLQIIFYGRDTRRHAAPSATATSSRAPSAASRKSPS